MINPFTVLVAQEVAGLDAGIGLAAAVAHFPAVSGHRLQLMSGATRGGCRPTRAPRWCSILPRHNRHRHRRQQLGLRQQVVLWLVLASLVLLVWGITQHGWYLVELGGVFVGLAVLCGLVAGMSPG